MSAKKPVNVEERLQILEARGIQDREDIQSLLERQPFTRDELPFTREEVRELMILASKRAVHPAHEYETFDDGADAVLEGVGR